MPDAGRNIIHQPSIYFELVGMPNYGAQPLVPLIPEGGIFVAELIIAAGTPAISDRVNVSNNNVVAFIIDGLDSTLFALYGAHSNDSTLHPLYDWSGSPIELIVSANRCIMLNQLLEGFNYFAVLHDTEESAERTIQVLTVPRT